MTLRLWAAIAPRRVSRVSRARDRASQIERLRAIEMAEPPVRVGLLVIRLPDLRVVGGELGDRERRVERLQRRIDVAGLSMQTADPPQQGRRGRCVGAPLEREQRSLVQRPRIVAPPFSVGELGLLNENVDRRCHVTRRSQCLSR